MIPNASEVIRRRWTIATVLRVLSIPVFLSAAIPILSWIAEGIQDSDLLDVSWYWPRMFSGAVLMIGGAAGFALAGLIARFVVPARDGVRCPRCRYRLEGLVEARCPECGLTLTPEFLGVPGEPDKPEPSAVHLVKLRDTLVPILRLAGGILVFVYFFAVIGRTFYVVVEAPNSQYPIAVIRLMHSWLGLLVGAVLLFRGQRVAALLVPKPDDSHESPPTAPDGANTARTDPVD